MEPPSIPDEHEEAGVEPNSCFQKTVTLTDWWLVMLENDLRGTQVSVAGYAFGEQAKRFFSSAPILRIYDVFTLETTDGICVILKSLVNKTRCLENGFSSDLFKHFVFGFPTHWKEFAEKCFDRGVSAANISGTNPVLEQKSLGQETVEDGQPHEDGLEKDLRSTCTTDPKVTKKKKTKSADSPLCEKSHSVVINSEENSAMTCTSSEDLEKQSHTGGPTVENQTNLVNPLNYQKSATKSLTPSSLVRNVKSSEVNNRDVYDFQDHDNFSSLSACKSKSKKTANNLRKEKLEEKNTTRADLNMDNSLPKKIRGRTGRRQTTLSMSRLNIESQTSHGASGGLSKKIIGRAECRSTTRSMSRLNIVSQTLQGASEGQKISPYSVSFKDSEEIKLASHDSVPRCRNKLHFEVTELDEPAERINLIESDAGSLKDKLEQISETPKQDKNMRRVETKDRVKKAKNKLSRSHMMSTSAENEMENVVANKYNVSQNAEVSRMNPSRPLAYETPEREKEKVSNVSSQSLSFKRSRSGRLLMPTLQFWRNQTAIYDPDRTVVGIKECIHLEDPRTGSGSESRRKR